MTQQIRILIIEDEPNIAIILYTSLSKLGYFVDTAKTGVSGLRKANVKNYDLILLDLNLPDMSGLSICRQLRSDDVPTPIIVLTGENTVRSKVSLLDAGANDYVTKPFSFEELRARIRTCLRKVAVAHDTPELLMVGDLQLSISNRIVERSGVAISLTRKQTDILEYLMLHAGHSVTRSSLIRHAWNSEDDAWTNTVDVHIKHLRDKIDRPFPYPLIRTVHGIGYKLLVPKLVAEAT